MVTTTFNEKSGPLGTTNYLYDGSFQKGWNVVEELDSSGDVLARFTQQGQMMDQSFAALRSGVTSYFEQDGIGSVTSLSNSAAALSNTYTYDSFGNLTASSGSLINPFRYTGREFDPETGIYEYRARYYDPTVGRFSSEDLMGFDSGINFYGYVKNRPLDFVDPLGLSSVSYVNGLLYVYDGLGNFLGVCPATNKTWPNTEPSWPPGSYAYIGWKNHTPDPNGPYGSYGIFFFKHPPPCQGCGLHSGRANKGGPSYPTAGCIRTTDSCMDWLTLINITDPIKRLVVWGSN